MINKIKENGLLIAACLIMAYVIFVFIFVEFEVLFFFIGFLQRLVLLILLGAILAAVIVKMRKEDSFNWQVYYFYIIMLIICVELPFYVMTQSLFEETNCHVSTVVEKRITGEANNIQTVFVEFHNGEIIEKAVDNETFFNIEIGDTVDYCVSVHSITGWVISTKIERIEQ